MVNMDKCFDIADKVSIVTGGGSGLGRGIAEGYGQFGAVVAVVDINEGNAKNTAEGIVKAGGNAVAIRCDATKPEDVKHTVDEIIAKFGKIDILVNSAGISKRSKAEDMTDEDWNSVLDINLKGTFLFCREVGRHMINQGHGGRIINISSISGVVGLETGNANYAASKGGVIAMTRCLALEWAKHNILVNNIAPTHIKTPLIEEVMKEKPEVAKYFLGNIPMGRLGNVEDVVGPAIFLAAPAASFITGHTLLVDGGHTAK